MEQGGVGMQQGLEWSRGWRRCARPRSWSRSGVRIPEAVQQLSEDLPQDGDDAPGVGARYWLPELGQRAQQPLLSQAEQDRKNYV